jgi:predicted acyltransferase
MKRLLSLDVFRGLTIASMILVNNPGSGEHIYAPLEHAEWSGWTPTDMVFPFFLWISGMAMTLSFARRVEEGADKGKLLLHTARRAAAIVGLGLLLNLVPKFDFEHVRIPGVLQRIGVCYFFGTLIYLYTSRRGQVVAVVALLLSYTGLMLFGPLPEPSLDRWGVENNFARLVDGMLLPGHLWAKSKVWDPEGIVSTLPAIGTVLLGALAGYLLKAGRWQSFVLYGVPLAVAGLLLDFVVPINKALWTPSFALLMAGLASTLFGLLYWVVEVKQWRGGTRFFEIYGTNAIVSYVLSGALARFLSMGQIGGVSAQKWIFENVFLPVAAPKNASLLFALTEVAVLFGVMWLLWRKKWFLRL